MGGFVGRLVAVGKDTGWASVGVALTGNGEGRATVSVKVASTTGLGVGRGVVDGSGDGATVASTSCRVDDGSGNGVLVTATTGKGSVGNGVVAVCGVWAHAANAVKQQNIKMPSQFLCFTFSPILPAITSVQNIVLTCIGANDCSLLEILHYAIETLLSPGGTA
jgi:hypothetical protein